MDFVTPPWDHQKKAVGFSFNHRDVALLWEMGTGKTKTTIDILRGRYATYGRLLRTLILAPPVVLKNWEREFRLHSRINQGSIVVLRGSGRKRIFQLKEAVIDPSTNNYDAPKIILTNYEALENKEIIQLLDFWNPEVLVADESQRCKNHKSKRAQAVTKIADRTRHNYILTGTPILNSSMDLFMQYRILDRGETFGKNFYSFRGLYFEDENAGMPSDIHFAKWVPRPGTYAEFQHRLYRKGLRATKDECLDLPPLIKTLREVELNDEQKRLYKEMRDDYITFIKTNSEKPRAVVAQLAVTKALRLQQIVSGFAKDEEGTCHGIADVPRLAALEELLEQLTGEGHKVIVWAVFRENYSIIRKVCETLGLEFAEIHGDISTNDKEKNLQRFEKDPECKVMIANQSAGGIGVNMVAASYSIYYSKNFSYGDDAQSESRNHRGGSERHEKITRIDLVAEGTIDELINEALKAKKNIGDLILDWKL